MSERMERGEEDALVAMRRHLHANPELSFEEERTARYIEERLREVGITSIERVSGTGVVATIEGEAGDGPTLAFRGDIDALPIMEEGPHDYISTNPGVMHACGHDVHTTLGLGVARALWRSRADLHGRVKCVFQPAEEASPTGEPIGAERMVVDGVLEDPKVDGIFAFHCMPTLEVGKIGYTGGPVWARSDLVEIEIRGEKTHGAYPHSGIDAAVIAAHVVVALQTIPARRIDAREPCVLSVGKIEAGTSYNIVAERAQLTGILRTLSDETSAQAARQIHQTVEGVCAAFGAGCEVRLVPGARLTANAAWLEEAAVEAMRGEVGREALVAHAPQMGAEDFAAFSTRVPGCYLFLGVRNEERGIVHMLHTSRFDVDERCLSLGVRAMSAAIKELASTWGDVAPA